VKITIGLYAVIITQLFGKYELTTYDIAQSFISVTLFDSRQIM